ncbi:hypothetical protein Ppro_0817 [Pelobacter propionicus DSM 2379]|uniref:Uncharacterized protein n=2 Tax=Pelobacter propionicus TaxID=29543 RepID=A1AM77_PELPD|nr:hypothetical protein Ppro_0817 [Pelobacter propionicus DSM 2379]
MRPVHSRSTCLAARMLLVFLSVASVSYGAAIAPVTAADPGTPRGANGGGTASAAATAASRKPVSGTGAGSVKNAGALPETRSHSLRGGGMSAVVPPGRNGRARSASGALQRDPFSVTNRVRTQSERPPAFSPYGSEEGSVEQARTMPKMRLRGHLRGTDGRIAALLEIEGAGVYIVRERDTVGLHELGIDTAIRIKKINRLNMLVEAGSLGRMIIVH